MTKYTCPNGHTCTGDEGNDLPHCHQCSLVATGWNTRTGEAYDWQSYQVYLDNVQQMNDQMDAAFDNQYFSGGW